MVGVAGAGSCEECFLEETLESGAINTHDPRKERPRRESSSGWSWQKPAWWTEVTYKESRGQSNV